jgi:hypothetical protein
VGNIPDVEYESPTLEERFAAEEWSTVKHAPIQLYKEHTNFINSLGDGSMGFKTLTQSNVGTLDIFESWFNTFRKLSIKSATYFPVSKPEVGMSEFMEREYLGDLKSRVLQRKEEGKFREADVIPVIRDLGALNLYLSRLVGSSRLRDEMIIHKLDPADLITGKRKSEGLWESGYMNIIIELKNTWYTSFPYDPLAFYRVAYMVFDSKMPQEEQIIPNLVYRSRGIKPKRGEERSGTETYHTQRQRRVLQEIAKYVNERKENKLCPAHILKLIAEKSEVSAYTSRLKNALNVAKRHRRRLTRVEVGKLLEDDSFGDLLFMVPEKGLIESFKPDNPPKELYR